MATEKKSSIDQILSETASRASKILRETFSSPKEREAAANSMAVMEEKIAVQDILNKQKKFFKTGATLDVEYRIKQLNKLYSVIKEHEDELNVALRSDLFKSPFESYATEIGICLKEISYTVKHLKKWAKPKIKGLEIETFPALSKVYPVPMGSVLIISAWNYPFLLSIQPLIHSMAAGNTTLLKTSCRSPATSALIQKLITDNFEKEFVAVHEGGEIGNNAVINQTYDLIFFTGSVKVGSLIMQAAARTMTPVVLELGGKNPCIVDSSADLEMAVRRIVWGKFLNAGQTSIAPDYILANASIKDKLIIMLDEEIKNQYGKNPLRDDDYPKMVDSRHFAQLVEMYPEVSRDPISNKIAPSVVNLGVMGTSEVEESPLMKKEIFGPILPVISWESFDEVIDYVNSKPSPLAMYLFSNNKLMQNNAVMQIRCGGGCINDCVVQIASHKIPFGGIGMSGMGAYHGKAGFDTFTHYKGIYHQSAKKDLNIRYAPHMDKVKIIKKLMK